MYVCLYVYIIHYLNSRQETLLSPMYTFEHIIDIIEHIIGRSAN